MRKPVFIVLLVALATSLGVGAIAPAHASAASGCTGVGKVDGATSGRWNLGTIYTTACANTNAGRGTISFQTFNTDKGSLNYQWTTSAISVSKATPGYNAVISQSCALGDLPTSRSTPGFGGFTWPVVSTKSCAGVFRGLEPGVTYHVSPTLSAGVRDDGRGAISAWAGGYQIRTTL